MPNSTDFQDSLQGVYGTIGGAATLDFYAQRLINSFDAVNGQVNSSQASFVMIILQMHPWFTTSLEFFQTITQNAQLAMFDLDEKRIGTAQNFEVADSSCIRCTCSDLQLRRRNNKYLSRIMSDEPSLGSSTGTLSKASEVNNFELLLTANDCVANGALTCGPAYCSALHPANCRKVCFALKYWMQKFPVHFEPGTELSEAARRFRKTLQKESSELYKLVSSDDIPSYDWMRKITAKISGTQRTDSQNKISLVFHHLSSEELAKHLSYIDYKACRRIPLAEYKRYAHSGFMSGCSQLERSVTILNGLTQWVQLMVLSKTHPRQRAAVISKFIQVSQHLVNLKSFNTCMAVVGGIGHSSIARLHKTYSCISVDSLKTLEELTNLISARNNYQNYRRAASQVENDSYSLPIIGVHLKDLVAIHTGHPDTVEGEPQLINFPKFVQLSNVISCLTKLHDNLPDYSINSDLIATLKLALDIFYSEEEIFELSLAREPRVNVGITAAGGSEDLKSVDQQNLLSEWQTGLKPPDKDTVSKHVSNMVTAIFKNYDLDRDGYISVEEFETISSNFPFIESSFCILDVSDNGLLSEGEIKKYFILAKCSSLKRSFKHNFAETTYFKLTYCEHCSGLLWGLIKQGWKCRDCGINAHKSCKDRVVMDCKPKAVNNGQPKNTSALICNSASNSTLSLPSSPQTPSTPELVHLEPRFTFSRLSTKGVSPCKATATPISDESCFSLMNDESCGTYRSTATSEFATPSLSQSYLQQLGSDMATDSQLLTMKLSEYQHLLFAKDKELHKELEEKRLLQDRCLNQSHEILALKRQLSEMKTIAAKS
ncbi:ras guanyl-releasing protein 3-like [Watersipora subatra]|uniref:ras guanyl-releasing protein 3-like n=1 Tax=Watersipora subatra TaxID=2589382 RepID=UPI00355B2890